jgi:cellulose synthase/poly-beta-1,6-N-acetylglucosamine synthase-like glycosyltransferase
VTHPQDNNTDFRKAITQRPSLSVVVPMYQEFENVDPLIEQVHESLKNYAGPWELICIDDGSTDGTGDRVQRAIEKYGPYVRLIRFRRNLGQTAARPVLGRAEESLLQHWMEIFKMTRPTFLALLTSSWIATWTWFQDGGRTVGIEVCASCFLEWRIGL